MLPITPYPNRGLPASGETIAPLQIISENQVVEEVGIPGLEPRITGPESVVLPITPYPNFCDLRNLISELRCKGTAFF